MIAAPLGGGSVEQVEMALETLARGHYIWDAEHGYRLARRRAPTPSVGPLLNLSLARAFGP
jgi:hypothetical protein